MISGVKELVIATSFGNNEKRQGNFPFSSFFSSQVERKQIFLGFSSMEKKAVPVEQQIPLKVVFIGDAVCGKTSLIGRYLSPSLFKEGIYVCSFIWWKEYQPTLEDQQVKNVEHGGRTFQLTLWDTGNNLYKSWLTSASWTRRIRQVMVKNLVF